MLYESVKIFFSFWFIYLMFGMIFGSFLNVVIYRVPNGLSIVHPPSACPKCGHTIKWYENIPVLSWIFLRGKCSECKLPISVEYPIVELIVGLITLGLYLHFGPSLQLIVYIPLSYTLFCIMMIDFKTYSIPHGLNLTLFVISILGVIMNFSIVKFLDISILNSFLGGLTGFGILFLIQIAGKIIYKQDAIGTGDLFLLGSAGILLGPKLTFISFILGSLTAVLSYAVPSLINLINRRGESLKYKNIADHFKLSGKGSIDEKADILGLKLQLNYNLKNEEYKTDLDSFYDIIIDNKFNNITLLRLFFRLVAIEDKFTAIDILKKIEPASETLISDIRQVITEDLIGYDSFKDNYNLLLDYSKDAGYSELTAVINAKKDVILEDTYLNSVEEINKAADSISDKEEKLDFLLKHNRYFQFSGYTAEQKNMVEFIENKVDLTNPDLKQKYYSDLSFVYFKDFFFEDSKIYLNKLLDFIKSEKVTSVTIKNIYNIALFRIYFYKQRLAFGPFLAIGIMISLLWGNMLFSKYMEFMKKFLM